MSNLRFFKLNEPEFFFTKRQFRVKNKSYQSMPDRLKRCQELEGRKDNQ